MAEASPSEAHGRFRVGQTMVSLPITFLAEVCIVPRLTPFLAECRHLIGGLDLRGQLVPVIDIAALTGSGGQSGTPPLAAILRHDGRMLGIAIDEIVDFAHPDPASLQQLDLPGAAAGLVDRCFLLDGQVVSALDVPALFARPDAPSVPAGLASDSSGSDPTRRTLLTMQAGSASFAIDAVQVHGTVPRQQIDPSEIGGGACLGLIRHQGWKIPIVDPCQILDLGRGDFATGAEIVVLRFPDNRRLGLAVTSINEITTVAGHRITANNPALGTRDLLPETLQGRAGDHIHIISHAAFVAHPVLSELAQLSEKSAAGQAARTVPAPPSAAQDAARPAAEAGRNVIPEQDRYIVFRAGEIYAARVDQIVRIIEHPDTLTPVNRPQAGISGVFPLGAATVALSPLSGETGHPGGHVLLVGEPGRQVGFAVDQVIGMRSSNWRAPPRAGAPDPLPLVELRQGSETEVLPVIDLAARAEALTAA